MKLHKDGTVEGTPQEIAEYNRLTSGSTVEDQRAEMVKLLDKLNKQAIASPTKQERDTIIREADAVRGLMRMQEEYWKNRKPEDRPTVTFGDNLSRSLDKVAEQTGLTRSVILGYVMQGTKME